MACAASLLRRVTLFPAVAALLLSILPTPSAAQTPPQDARTTRLTSSTMAAGLKLLAIDSALERQNHEDERRAAVADSVANDRVYRVVGDIVGNDKWQSVRKADPRAAVPENAHYDASCSSRLVRYVAATFTLGASSLRQEDFQGYVAASVASHGKKAIPVPPEAARARELFWAFYLPRGFVKQDHDVHYEIARAWLPPKGDLPGLYVRLSPFNWYTVTLCDRGMPSGPVIEVKADLEPGQSMYRRANERRYAQAARDRAAVLRVAHVADDDDRAIQDAAAQAIDNLTVDGPSAFDAGPMRPAESAVRRANARLLCSGHQNALRDIYTEPTVVASVRDHCAILTATAAEPDEAPAAKGGGRGGDGGGGAAKPATAAWNACLKTYFPEVPRLVAAYERAEKSGDRAAVDRAVAALTTTHDRAVAKCGPDPTRR